MINDKITTANVDIEIVEDDVDFDAEEVEAIRASSRDVADATDEERAKFADIKKVVIPESVRKQMEEAGISPQDLVGMLMRAGKKPN